ncbi:MAG: tRNA (guanosine(46)-N7)-methyltransferase TrmB [Proteobacteria bacterium]|jgi:tRNA (guanine-N7-)-methyltransferase|uniref:tRNA (guanine-N(7)-)-methyltransferase n=1 Tax=SAR92 bacterium BACL26 MAG-121220-bin70 TaxID=1655626 RepID=A0A0R2UC23_9GAMM|nr:MAG: tRNA (guanine-N7)-methyltransferase [SAR92 bacterium BACL26 MAG-121220-bin70]MDA0796264.1 tRNA (guanosine(46)-N7)-methyltransferase TrmB [Pseudomonadota bacterium]MDA1351750.1 tRNA (guanosine(46)-N7)-methyltransferase TrmB [Pseudomonadota bacterium]
MDIRPEYRKKSIRSYVVRAGRMTDGQRKAFETSWPIYGLKLADGAINTDEVFGRSGLKILEIGFGMGDSLLQMAAAEPESDFIGIEVHPPGVGTIINTARVEGLANLRIYLADANDVLDECFAPASIDRLQLYFPDPWHKKKHNKRRIVQPSFLQQVREKLRPNGIIHMATDWQPYAEQMLEILSEAAGFENCAGPGESSPRPAYRPLTKFEKRGERLGHGVWDFIFKKTS